METETNVARFEPGAIIVTQGVSAAMTQSEILDSLIRHLAGDWVDDVRRRTNEKALADGERILSSFVSSGGTPFWVITEADRSATTFLLPKEY